MTGGMAASIHARLLTCAKESGEDFNHVLSRYAIERFLYRLSISSPGKEYCLKGAQLFRLWFEDSYRPTRDADLLAPASADRSSVADTMAGVVRVDVDDGMRFDFRSVTVEVIREEARYGGLRVKIAGQLGNARCPVQLDVGFGDAVEPAPRQETFPTLLPDLPAPRLLVYPRSAVMAEKLEAIVQLGMANSRMKDYFDLYILVMEGKVAPAELARSIAVTFARRGTPLPGTPPLGLSDTFSADSTKRAQWRGFVSRNQLDAPALEDVISVIRNFVF